MAQFSIKPDNARKAVTEEEKYILELAGFEEEVQHVRNSLGFRVMSSANIRSRLKCAADKIEESQNSMRGMKNMLSDSLDLYDKTENAILGNVNIGNGIEVKNIPGGILNFDASGEMSDLISDKVWDAVKPWIGNFGVMGSAAVMLDDIRTADFTTGADWADLAKSSWGVGWGIEGVVKTCKGNTSVKWWKEALGLNPNSFLKSIKNANLSGLQKAKHGFNQGVKGTLRGFRTVKGTTKQIGGIALSGVVNAFGNYEEYRRGEISADRAVVETVMETAVDWGKGLLIGAGVAAGFAAAGVAAPAVVVGAAAVGISMAADWICEKVTGKNVTELVSDAIVDVGYQIKDDATALWSGITNGWNALTGNAGAAYA